MALVAPSLPKMNTGYSMSTNNSEDRDIGNGFEVCPLCCMVTDRVVYKKKEMASFIITGISKLGFILLETCCPESGI
jgi:hypothetical protein